MKKRKKIHFRRLFFAVKRLFLLSPENAASRAEVKKRRRFIGVPSFFFAVVCNKTKDERGKIFRLSQCKPQNLRIVRVDCMSFIRAYQSWYALFINFTIRFIQWFLLYRKLRNNFDLIEVNVCPYLMSDCQFQYNHHFPSSNLCVKNPEKRGPEKI